MLQVFAKWIEQNLNGNIFVKNKINHTGSGIQNIIMDYAQNAVTAKRETKMEELNRRLGILIDIQTKQEEVLGVKISALCRQLPSDQKNGQLKEDRSSDGEALANIFAQLERLESQARTREILCEQLSQVL